MSGSNLTVAQQLAQLHAQVRQLQAGQSGGGASDLQGRVATLERTVSARRWLPARETPSRRSPNPLPPLLPLVRRLWFPAAPLGSLRTVLFPPPPAPATKVAAQLNWLAGTDPNDLVLLTAETPLIVLAIEGRLEVAEGAAATVTIVKAASGAALSLGTPIHAGTFDANGTPATNQVLTLSGTIANICLAAGDSLGVQTTGAWTTSTGGITVTLSS